jgi:16S rRNA (guanine(966)-N(2))-methyltransferase RsmD
MRIIAGTAKGHTLKTPASITRPTMDRVRAAIFSILGERVPNASVLDLFAGTGAMGIEALSRGAAAATFVDQDKKSVEVIRQNLMLTKLKGELKQGDVLSFLKHQQEKFDLIFADPPYASKSDTDWISKLLTTPELLKAMNEEALLVLECEKSQLLPEVVELEKIIDRTYGITRVVIFKLEIRGQASNFKF